MKRLELFCEELHNVLTRSDDQLNRARDCLKAWIEEGVEVPRAVGDAKPDTMVQYLLRTDIDNLFTVVSMVMAPHYATPIHNHGTWGLVGIVDGEEREERFDVSLDSAGIAHVHLRGEQINRASAVTVLASPHDEIHRITNLGDTPSRSIHVYGGNLDGLPRLAYQDGLAPITFVTRLERLSS